jgi:hypothetical protein
VLLLSTVAVFTAIQLKSEHFWQLINPGADVTVDLWLTLLVFKLDSVEVLILPCFEQTVKLLHMQLVVEEIVALFFYMELARPCVFI